MLLSPSAIQTPYKLQISAQHFDMQLKWCSKRSENMLLKSYRKKKWVKKFLFFSAHLQHLDPVFTEDNQTQFAPLQL